MKQTIIFIIILGAMLVTACSKLSIPDASEDQVGQSITVGGGKYTNISVSELQSILEDKDFTFVNVHIPFAGDLPQTDLSIPFDEIDSNLDQLPVEKNAKIVIYCRSGSMSSEAAATLVELGYTNVWNLSGGFNAWQSAGLPLEGK